MEKCNKRIRVLVLTNLYPTPFKPQWGTFVQEQVNDLSLNHDLIMDVYLVDGAKSKFNYLKAICVVPFIARKKKYDIVHVHYGLTMLVAIFVKLPIILTFHGTDALKSPLCLLNKLLSIKAKEVIAVSNNIRSKIGRGIIIPCGIDALQFEIDSFKLKKRSNKTISLLFPGDPNNKIKNYTLFKSVCDEIRCFGYSVEEVHLKKIPRKRVPSIFWESDIMLLTSFSEGSPTVLKEAIAAKLPFISVDVGDVRFWSDMVDFGFIVEKYDPKIIAERCIKIFNNYPNRPTLENDRAVSLFDLKSTNKKIVDLYKAVVANNNQKSSYGKC